jgi:glycine dehydrogenase
MTDAFVRRHVGPGAEAVRTMLSTLGLNDLDELVEAVVPASIRLDRPLDLPAARDEVQALADLSGMAGTNQVLRTYLGAGYHDTITPPVILRNILENPGWYTAYTPYQAEIAQGRLEALLVFQMVVQDLTGFEVSNASLLDEATAAAEAMTMAKRVARKNKSTAFFAAEDCHPQTLAVVRTRAEALGYELVVGDPETFDFDATPVFGVLVQMVGTGGEVHDHRAFAQRAHDAGALVIAAVDLLALAVIAEPVAWGPP